MHILYLKAPDRASLEAALENAGITEDGAPADPRFLVDVIGAIYRETGETLTDERGFETPVAEPVEGFHANLAIRWPVPAYPDDEPGWLSPEAWEAIQPIITPTPDTPKRVWA